MSTTTEKPRVRIQGAKFIPLYSDDGKAEIMTGYTENHPNTRLNNGRIVYTSKVIRKSESEVETLNTIYELVKDANSGSPAEGWVQRAAAGPAGVGIPV